MILLRWLCRLRRLCPRAGLIALAVWFPVTMLTASGVPIPGRRTLTWLDTLGAGGAYLIFRIAIPARFPNIFIGLFHGLGAFVF